MAINLPYRQSVGIMLLNTANLVWIGRRSNLSGAEEAMYRWQMPQGGITSGEDPAVAALRELEEETGVRGAVILAEAREWRSYELPAEALASLGGRYRGQRMKWFAMRFLGEDGEIDCGADQGGGPEFDGWRWAPVDEVAELVVPFKRRVYDAVIAEFRPLFESA